MLASRIVAVALVSFAAIAAADPLPPPLGTPTFKRNRSLITKFSWDRIAPDAEHSSVGGWKEASLRIENCSDDPGQQPAPALNEPVLDDQSGVTVSVVKATPAGKSGRGWLGTRCRFRVVDRDNPDRWVELEAPPFNTLRAILRAGDHVYLALQWNGYASEIGGKGNFVVEANLATHQSGWRSTDLSCNGGMMRVDDYLIVGYGFTKEKASLSVLDRRSGEVVQTLALPKAPDSMRLDKGKLYVQIYDGYATIPWLAPPR